MQVIFFYNRIPDKEELCVLVSLSRTIHWYEAREVSKAITFWQFVYLCHAVQNLSMRALQHVPFSFSKLFFRQNILKTVFCGNLSCACNPGPLNLRVLSIPCDISAPVSIWVPVSLDFKISLIAELVGANTIYRRNYFTVIIWFVASRKKKLHFLLSTTRNVLIFLSASQFLVYIHCQLTLIWLSTGHTQKESKFIPRGFEHWRSGADGENNRDATS